MISLRRSLEVGLRHPLLGPLLLLFLGLILAFMVLHTVEHGAEGLLFSCALLTAVGVRLVVVLGRISREGLAAAPQDGRAPPRRAVVLPAARGSSVGPIASPLRL